VNKGHLILLLAVLGGVVFADKIRAIPVVGPHIPTI
jgi:hypothetical protein